MGNYTRRKELQSLFLGEQIGEGMSRKVYEYHDPLTGAVDRAVVKYEGQLVAGHFQNVAEWEIWEWVRATPMQKWFAPCYAISPCGLYLIQARVDPLRRKEWPKKLPAFLGDLKTENFGMLEGRVVACDYGTGISAIRSSGKRMVACHWRV